VKPPVGFLTTVWPSVFIVLAVRLSPSPLRDGVCGHNRRMTLPRPGSDDQLAVVAAVWEFVVSGGRWPTFRELDHRLYQAKGLDTTSALRGMPPGIVIGMNAASGRVITDDHPIRLTVAGVHATGQASQELELFLKAVRQAVLIERAHDPSTAGPPGPVLGPAALTDAGPKSQGWEATASRVSLLLQAEPWGYRQASGTPGGSDWAFVISRDVRRFASAADLESYWHFRPKPWQAQDHRTPSTPQGDVRAESISKPPFHETMGATLGVLGAIIAGQTLGWGWLRTVSLVALAVGGGIIWHLRRVGSQWRSPSLILAGCGSFIAAVGVTATFLIASPSERSPNATAGSADQIPSSSAPPAVQPSPSNQTKNPFDLKVFTKPEDVNPNGDPNYINDIRGYLFPAGALAKIPVPDSLPGCFDYHTWAHENGGVDVGQTVVAVNLTALTSATVQVVGARLAITPKTNPPTKGDVAACDQGDETTKSYLEIDLDKGSQAFHYRDSEAEGGHRIVPFAINVKAGAPERIYVKAVSGGCYCSWYLDLHLLVEGTEYWERVDDRGEPFATVDDRETYRRLLWDGQKWCSDATGC
jgi:hypothetical protein